MKRFVVTALAAAVLALPASASASVRLVSLTSPASPGSTATLVAKVSARATCSITVIYKSGPSVAQGLYPKTCTGDRPRQLELDGRHAHNPGSLADHRQLRQRGNAQNVVRRLLALRLGTTRLTK